MSFITSGSSVLPAVKQDARVPTGVNTEWKAADSNQIRQALLDVQQYVLNLQAQITSVPQGLSTNLSPYFVTATGSANARTLAARASDIIWVDDWGADPTGTNDSTTAIQNALNAAGSGKRVMLGKGTYNVSSTILITSSSMIFGGQSPEASVLTWIGSSGSPLLRLVNCQSTTVENMSLVGNSTTPPSTLLSIQQTTGTSEGNIFRSLQIGGNTGWPMATNGIYVEADSAAHDGTNSEHLFEQIAINNCTVGIRIAGIQNSNATIVRLNIAQCKYGVWSPCIVYGWSWQFANNGTATYGNGADLYLPSQDDFGVTAYGQFLLYGFYSELAGRLAIWGGLSGGRLDIQNGNFQTTNLPADGDIIHPYTTGVAASADIRLVNFTFGGPTGTAPSVQLNFGPISGSAGSAAITVDIVYPQVWNLNGGLNGSGFNYPTSGSANAQSIRIRSLESANTSIYKERVYIGDALNGQRFLQSPDVVNGCDSAGIVRRFWTGSTSNATPVTLGSFTTSLEVAGFAVLRVIAATTNAGSPTSSDNGAWEQKSLITQSYYQYPGPSFVGPTLSGTTSSFSQTTSGAGSWAATMSMNSSTSVLSVNVTGDSSRTVYWSAILEIMPVSTNPSYYNP